MIGWETRVLLKHYLAEGVSQAAIARQLGISRRTVYRWIQAGELDRELDVESVHYTPRPPVPRKIDPYRAILYGRKL